MAPSITSLSPNSGVAGDQIQINGSGFGNSRGTSSVSFNGTPAASYGSWSSTKVTVTVPSGGTSGSLTITVGGVASGGSFFWYQTPSFPGSVKTFVYQDTGADSSADITKADAADINLAFQEIEAIEERLSTHLGAGGTDEHPNATTSVAGFMSAADKTSWDQHHGKGGTSKHPAATSGDNGFLSTSDKSKLDGITYYDSGWFNADVNIEYTINHNLSTEIPLVNVEWRQDADDTNRYPVELSLSGVSNQGVGPQIRLDYDSGLDTNNVFVLAKDYLIILYDVSSGPSYKITGQYRVVVRRFE